MKITESGTQVKLNLNHINLEKYDVTDCLDILRYLQNSDKADLQSETYKKFIYQLECRIKTLVLQK